ncbi:MAG: caudovirus prohead protease [Eisenbergiella sp.]
MQYVLWMPVSGLWRKKRTVSELSFSSEEPYTRWYGVEILDHSDECMELERLQSIGVVLLITRRIGYWGRLQRHGRKMAGEKHISNLTMTKKLSNPEKGGQRNVKGCVGRVQRGCLEEVAAGRSPVTDALPALLYCKKWTPLEVSIVSVPADPTVGVGRCETEGMRQDYQI